MLLLLSIGLCGGIALKHILRGTDSVHRHMVLRAQSHINSNYCTASNSDVSDISFAPYISSFLKFGWRLDFHPDN